MTNTIALILLFQLAAPDAATMSYPTMGYALSGGRLIRLTGVPGACSAAPEPGYSEYLTLHSASTARVILLTSGGESAALLYRTPIGDTRYVLSASPTATALSPSGLYFAALSSSGLAVYRRTAKTALGAGPLHALPVPATQITSILISDAGDLVLQTPTGFWYSATPTEPATFTLVPTTLTLMRFAPRDHLLVGFEPGQGRVVALHPRASFAIEPLLLPRDLTGEPAGLEFAPDGFSFWLSHQAGLVKYDLLRRTATPYDGIPTGALSGVVSPGVFLWKTLSNELAVLDTLQPDAPRVLLVPTAQDELK
jgi:hypothetical protein